MSQPILPEASEQTWRLLPDGDNPFPFPVLDHRQASLGLRSRPADEATAARFEALRGDDAPDLRRRPIQGGQVLPVRLDYPAPTTPLADGCLFRADRPEERWDIFLFEGHLVFRRSWTGEAIFRARVSAIPEGLLLTELEVHPDWLSRMAPAQVDFLVWSHLFGRPVPHPVPKGALQQPERAIGWSLQTYGCLAWFAVEEDPTAWVRMAADEG